MGTDSTFEIKWFNRLHIRILAIFVVLFALIMLMILSIVKILGANLIEQQSYLKLENAGHLVISKLENRTVEAASLAAAMAKIAAELPTNNRSFEKLIQQVIDHQGSAHLIAGGGVWPEPYKFNSRKERDSFFWGREPSGKLKFYDDYNNPNGTGYQNEEWYVPVKYLRPEQVYWSKSYTDPHSMQPMVTVSVPMKRDEETIGVSTIDLKLEGLQELLDQVASKFGGYAFAIDRNGRFLSFPDDMARHKQTIVADGSLIPYLNIDELADNQPEFKPLAALLDLQSEAFSRQLTATAQERDNLAARLASESYQIEPQEATLIANVLLKPSAATTDLGFIEKHATIPNDFLAKEPAYVSITVMPGTFWRVVTVMPKSVAHKETEGMFSWFLLVTMASLLSAMLLVWLLLRHNFTRPLLHLAKQVTSPNADSSTGTRLFHTDQKGELGMLVHWFNHRTKQLLESQDENERLAFFDSLTGLPNRRYLIDDLHRKVVGATRDGQSGAVLFLDLDHFKTLNDSLGHHVGDELLVQVSKRLTGCLREKDLVTRLGGDEFVIVLLDNKDSCDVDFQAVTVAQKVLNNMSSPFQLLGNMYHVTTSIGISLFPFENFGVEDILKQADTAMYQAKDKGRNSYCFFHNEMQQKADERLRVQGELGKAIERDELFLQYQPQICGRGTCRSVEALVRWQHPVDGQIAPAAFIPIAEESVLILSLGNWVLNEACRQLNEWNQQGLSIEHVAVNVSPRQFDQKHFVDIVQTTIKKHNIAPQQLMLEITEGVILEHTDKAIEKMNALHKLGVSISLDDFGTGYSSLTYLKHLPLNQIKIDQSFVHDLNCDSDNSVIVETIIFLAKQFRYKIIAEGVENETQRDLLSDKGCTDFQGYYFSKPLTPNDLVCYMSGVNRT